MMGSGGGLLLAVASLLWVSGQGQPRDYCFIMLSTEKPKYLGKNQAVALLNALKNCSLKSSWESSLHTLMNNPGNIMSSSGLSSLLASDNLLPSFPIIFVF